MTSKNIVDQLIGLYSNINQASKHLGKGCTVLMYWRAKGYIPVKWSKHIETVTDGQITESMIRRAAAEAISSTTI